MVNASFWLIENDQAFWHRVLSNQRTCTKYSIKCSISCRKPNKKRNRSTLFVAGQIACDFSLYWTIHWLRFIHVLLYLSRKKGICAIHLKEALFDIATKKLWFSFKKIWSHVISQLQSINNDQTFRTEKCLQ